MQPLKYSALERVHVQRPVDRLKFLEQAAKNKIVFDLGALDETAYTSKQTNESWLHARLCRAAKQVIGIDNSELIPSEGLITATNGRIVRANIFDLRSTVAEFGKPDLIVAGEIIEHLPDTSHFLQSLKDSPYLRGVEVILTTPNACCWHNLLIGIASRESMHKDHLQVYSNKTLRTIFERKDIQLEFLRPYYARFPEMIQTKSPIGSSAASLFQKFVNILELVTPMLSAGWIVKMKI